MKIYDSHGNILSDVLVTKDAIHEEEMMKSDFVRLSWNSDVFEVLPVDAYIIPFEDGIKYSLLEPYYPEQRSEIEWRYEPQFQHPKMYLSKVPFTRPSKDTANNDITYIDWPYTGSVRVLLGYIVDTINETFGFEDDKFSVSIIDFEDKVVTMNFSSQDILSALTNAANVCECEWHIDWNMRTLYFGRVAVEYGDGVATLVVGQNIQVSSTRNSKEGYWNAFMPQGSTRNIMRRSASEEFVQSDVRLSIKRDREYTFTYKDINGFEHTETMMFPDGVIYTDGNGYVISKEQFEALGKRPYVKSLIFEEIYPKNDLFISHVRYRERYMLDEDDKKVVAYTDDKGVVHYLKYAIWYFRLSRNIGTKEHPQWEDYGINQNVWLKAKILSVEDKTIDGHDMKVVRLSSGVKHYYDGMFTGTPVINAIGREYESDNSVEKANEKIQGVSNYIVNNNVPVEQYWPNVYDTYYYARFINGCRLMVAYQDTEYNQNTVPFSTPFVITEEMMGKRSLDRYLTVRIDWSQEVLGGKNAWSQETIGHIMPQESAEYEYWYHYIVDKQFIIGLKYGDTEHTAVFHTLDGTFDATRVSESIQSAFAKYDDTIELTLTTEEYEAFMAEVKNDEVDFQLTDGYDAERFAQDDRVNDIIDGTKPYIAFQPNTYRVQTGVDEHGLPIYKYAETTPLAGLGNGDGNGHYGFALRYLKMQVEKSPFYINDIKAEPTEEGDSGLCDINGNRTDDIDERWYEIEFEQNETTIIPSIKSQGIYPKSDKDSPDAPTLFGNMANVYNIVMGEDAEYGAQVELIEKTIEKIVSDLKDKTAYTFNSNPVAFEENNPNLYIGRKVYYDNANGLHLDTRVLKLTTHLDFNFEQEITVGNENLKGTQQQFNEKVEAIINGNSEASGAGGVTQEIVSALIKNVGGGLFLSKLEDDYAKGLMGFANGLWVGVKGLFGFASNGDIAANNVNAKGNAVIKGNAEIGGETAVKGNLSVGGWVKSLLGVFSNLKSPDYTGQSINDTGWTIINNHNGHSKMVIDELYVRMKAVFESLEVKREQVTGGNQIFSGAANVIARTEYIHQEVVDGQVEETILGYSEIPMPFTAGGLLFSLYKSKPAIFGRLMKVRLNLREEDIPLVTVVRCYFLAKDGDNEVSNLWQANENGHDLVRCQTFNLTKSKRETYIDTPVKAGNVFWWRKATKVSTTPVEVDGKQYHYVDVSMSDCMSGSDIPAAGDHMVQWGNDANPERMNIITIEVNGADSPAVKAYEGIYCYDMHKCWYGGNPCKMSLSPKSGYKFIGSKFHLETEYGIAPVPTNRGNYTDIPLQRDDKAPHDNVRKVYYYDQVSHNGSLWTCTSQQNAYWVQPQEFDNLEYALFNADGTYRHNGNYITDVQYAELSIEHKEQCGRVEGYITDEPSEVSSAWIKSVSKGDKGDSITKKSEVKQYVLSSDGVTPKSGEQWSDTKPTPAQGEYVLIKTIITWSDDSVTTLISAERNPNDGEPGMSVTILSQSVTYSKQPTGDKNPWEIDDYGAYPSTLVKGDWLYSKTTVTYSDNTHTDTYSVSYIGNDGAAGNGIVSITEYYAASASKDAAPADSAFGTGIPNDWNAQKPFLWNYEKTLYTIGEPTKTDKSVIAIWTENGKGLDSVTNYYLATDADSGVTRDTQGWTTAVQVPDADKPYLWNYEKMTWIEKDGTSSYTYTEPHVIGHFGKDGKSIIKSSADTYRYATNRTGEIPSASSTDWKNQKPTLEKGYWLFTETTMHWSDDTTTVLYSSERNPEDGQSGQDIIVDGDTLMLYCVTDSNTSHPAEDSAEWKPLSQVTQTKGKWLWSKATTNYKTAVSGAYAGKSVNYNVMYISKDGSAGRGIVAVTEFYKASANASGETAPSDDSGWTTDPNAAMRDWNESKKYLWNYERVEYSSGTQYERTIPQVLAIWTKDGLPGQGIDSITNYYKVTETNDAPQRPATDGTDGWSSSPITPDEEEPYLWNYEKIVWVNPSKTTYTEVQMLGHFGADGESPYFADIDNEMESVACDNSGKTTAAFDKYIGVSLWHGSTSLDITTLTTTSVSGLTITPDKANKRIRVQVAQGITIAEVNDITITIAGGDSGNKTLHFVLNGVRAGKNGEPAVLYSLVPSASSVVKKKNGTYSVNNISCTRQKNVGGTITDNITDGEIKYKLDGGSEQAYTNNTNIAVTTFTKSIQFIFRVDGKVVDTETIPMVADGTDGNGIVSITKTYGISSSGSTASDTTAPSDISSWSAGSPTVTDEKPYLWVKEITVFTDTTKNTTKYYCTGKKGDNGIDAQDVEFVYIRTKTNTAPTILNDNTYTDTNGKTYTSDDHLPQVNGNSNIENNGSRYQCTDDPKGVNNTWKFEWEIKRTKGAASNGKRSWNYYSGTMTLHNSLSESALVMDIDNEADQFGTDSNSIVVDEQVRTTNVSLYYGTQKKAITSLSAVLYYEDGTEIDDDSIAYVDYGLELFEGSVTVTVCSDADFSGYGGIYVEIEASCDLGSSKTARFTIQKVMSGAPGVSPTIYQLMMSESAYKFSRDANGSLVANVSSSTVKVKKVFKGEAEIISTALTGYTVRYGFDTQSAKESGKAIGSAISVSVTEANSYNQVWVELIHNSIVIDRETLPIIKDGAKGGDGNDAVVLKLSPENVIITQSTEADASGNYNLLLDNAKTNVSIAAGGSETTTGLSITATPSTHVVNGVSRPSCIVSVSGNTINIDSVDYEDVTEGTETRRVYVDSGYVDVAAVFNGKTYTGRFNFYCNLLGTWKETVVGDTKTEVAESIEYAINGTTGEVDGYEALGEFKRSSTENISRLEKKSVSNNLILNGAFISSNLNWDNWGNPDISEIVRIGDKNWMHIVSTNAQFEGYQQHHFADYGITVEPGGQYTISLRAHTASGSGVVAIGFHWYNGSTIIPDGGDVLQSWYTFNIDASDKVYSQTFNVPSGANSFNIFVGDNTVNAQNFYITEVKLEEGDIATVWTENVQDTYSEIKQTADEINLGITQGLQRTGIDIKHRLINLIADQTNFYSTNGVKMISFEMYKNVPSILFYDRNGRGDNQEDHLQWILNYHGFKQALETYKPMSWSEDFPYVDKGVYSDTEIISMSGYDKIFAVNMALNEGIRGYVFEVFHSAKYLQDGVWKYVDGGDDYENRYWENTELEDEMEIPSLTNNHNVSAGYYLVESGTEIDVEIITPAAVNEARNGDISFDGDYIDGGEVIDDGSQIAIEADEPYADGDTTPNGYEVVGGDTTMQDSQLNEADKDWDIIYVDSQGYVNRRYRNAFTAHYAWSSEYGQRRIYENKCYIWQIKGQTISPAVKEITIQEIINAYNS